MSESLYTGLQALSGADFTSCHHVGDVIDNDMLRTAAENGIALPTAGSTERDKYHGAIVFQPKPGVHRNVMYPDFSSLYPLIMVDLNASPETIIGVGDDALEGTPYTEDDVRWGWIDTRPVKRLSAGESWGEYTDGAYKMIYDPNKSTIKWRDDWDRIKAHVEPVYFQSPEENQGILPSRAETYICWNKSYSGTMYKATKRQRNGLYGVSGDSNFRLFDWRVGEAITLAGRYMLREAARYLTRVLGHDFERDAVYTTHGDSVPADEPILIRDEDGSVSVEAAHRVHERVTTGDSIETWTEDGWTAVRRSIQKPNRKEVYEVRTKAGTVRATEDHSLVRADGSEVSPEDVEVGDSLLVSDIGDALPSSNDSVREWSDEAAWLLGLFVADGTCNHYEYDHRSDKYPWAVANENRERLERAMTALEENWGVEASIRDCRESSGCWKLQVSGNGWGDVTSRGKDGRVHGRESGGRKAVVTEFRERCYVDGEKRVPPSILNGTESEREAFLAGYLEGDGGDLRYGIDEQPDEMTTKSRILATQLAMLLRDQGHQVTVDRQKRHENTYYRLRAVTYHQGDPATVTEVEQVEYDGDHVYDLETANHHFHAGVGSVVVHNTDGFGLAVDVEYPRSEILRSAAEAIDDLESEMLPNFMHDQFGVPPNACSQQVDLESYAAKLFVPADKGDRSLGGVKKTYVERLVLDECDADEADVSIAGQHFEEVDETSITGFRAIRSDVADVTVDVQSQVLKAIVSQPRSEARQTAYQIAEDAVEAIREGERSLEELGRRHGLSKDVHEYGSASRTPHPAYRGAKYAHKFIDGERFAEGGKPMVYPVDRVRGELPATYSAETAEDGQRVDYVAVEDASSLPDEIVLDREQLIEDTVEKALADIFGTLDWRWSDVVDDGVQSTLGGIELS